MPASCSCCYLVVSWLFVGQAAGEAKPSNQFPQNANSHCRHSTTESWLSHAEMHLYAERPQQTHSVREELPLSQIVRDALGLWRAQNITWDMILASGGHTYIRTVDQWLNFTMSYSNWFLPGRWPSHERLRRHTNVPNLETHVNPTSSLSLAGLLESCIYPICPETPHHMHLYAERPQQIHIAGELRVLLQKWSWPSMPTNSSTADHTFI